MRRAVFVALLLAIRSGSVVGQVPSPEPPKTFATVATVTAANALIGGLTASIHGMLAGRKPLKPFAYGAVGGGLHAIGKIMGTETRSLGILTNAFSATGSSIVANAGRGDRPFEEVALPIGMARIRVFPYSPSRVRFTLNAFELGFATHYFFRRDLRFDAQSSAEVGAFVFVRETLPVIEGVRANGASAASAIIIGKNALRTYRTRSHEVVHVQQFWFLQENVDRPVEQHLRRVVPFVRRIPSWIELGIFSPCLISVEWLMARHDGPLQRLREAEAEALETP